MSLATQIYSEIHYIILIHTHFPFITECSNDTPKCISPVNILINFIFNKNKLKKTKFLKPCQMSLMKNQFLLQEQRKMCLQEKKLCRT